MAKLSFTKLDLKKNNQVTNVYYNDEIIEVKQYLPINDKAELVATILNYTLNNGENRFPNPLQVNTFTVLGIIEHYTNISFTEKQKENPAKLYDLIVGNGVDKMIINAIPKEEYNDLMEFAEKAIKSYYDYHNSIFGILDSINNDYTNMNLDATEIQKKLADPENMALLRDVLSKLG